MESIHSVSEYLDALKEEKNKYSGMLWYRGHCNVEWRLLPGILRSLPTSEDILASEDKYLQKFRQCSKVLLNNTPSTQFEWLFWMQHHGVPTRLLDWSESPLVALYFALNDSTWMVSLALVLRHFIFSVCCGLANLLTFVRL